MKLYILTIIIILLCINNHAVEARSIKNILEIRYKFSNVIELNKTNVNVINKMK